MWGAGDDHDYLLKILARGLLSSTIQRCALFTPYRGRYLARRRYTELTLTIAERDAP